MESAGVSTDEELLGRKSSGSGLERRKYCSGDPSRSTQNLALTSLTSGGSSVGIVRLRTQATVFSFISVHVQLWLLFTSFSLLQIYPTGFGLIGHLQVYKYILQEEATASAADTS
jgi:hypothetical protein